MIVYAALVVRKVLIVMTAVFAPLAFAGSLADITVAWTRRWVELTLALIFSKVVLVLIFVLGYFMLVGGAGQAGSGGHRGRDPGRLGRPGRGPSRLFPVGGAQSRPLHR